MPSLSMQTVVIVSMLLFIVLLFGALVGFSVLQERKYHPPK